MKQLYRLFKQFYQGQQKTPIIVFILWGMCSVVHAQVNLYTFSQSNGTFNSIVSTGTLITGSEATTATTNDTQGWSAAIPFSFNFNGTDFTSVYVNSNGGAVFGSTTSTGTTVISSTTSYSGAIGVMNRDLWGVFITSGVTTSGSNIITNVASFKGIEVGKQLNNVNGIPAGATVTAFNESAGTITMSAAATSSSSAAVVRYGTGKIFTSTEGSAPNRVFVVEWIGYNDNGSTVSASNYQNFQLRLSETANTVSIVYGPTYNTSTSSRTNQIGLRGASNSDFNNRSGAVGNSWNSTSAGTANNSTVSRDNTNFPASGLTFTWSPPSCYGPTAVSVAGTTITQNGATISWTAPSTIPANGYDVYYSTSATAPTSGTVLNSTNSTTSTTTSAPLTGLLPSTTYYVWVRSKCTGSDMSIWTLSPVSFTTLCQPPSLLSTTGATICGASGSATISATADAGATITWYDASTAGSVLGTGNSYTTPIISSNTTYYVSAKTGTSMYVGPTTPNSLTASATTTAITTYYIQFEVTNPVTLVSTDVFPEAAGQSSTLEILQGPTTFSVINTIPFTSTIASDGTTPQTVPINVTLAPGTYRMRLSGGDYYRNYQSNAVFPYSIPNFSITTGSNVASNSYYFMYNLKVDSGCESPRQAVLVTVDSACLGTSEVFGTQNTNVYPNPFRDVLNISDVKNVKSVLVNDISGRLVKTIKDPSSVLQLGELKSGMYLLILMMKDGSTQTIKTIKK